MKAIARKTAPIAPPIPSGWFLPLGAPLGLCELRDGDRVIARVQPVNQRRVGSFATCDWKFEVFGFDGRVLASQTMEHGTQARERAERMAATFRKKGLV